MVTVTYHTELSPNEEREREIVEDRTIFQEINVSSFIASCKGVIIFHRTFDVIPHQTVGASLL